MEKGHVHANNLPDGNQARPSTRARDPPEAEGQLTGQASSSDTVYRISRHTVYSVHTVRVTCSHRTCLRVKFTG